MINIEYFEELLREKQYKLTLQRKAVLSIFLELPERHLTAEAVYGILSEQQSGIGLATVYRALELFDGLDLLEKSNRGDGCCHYEIKLPRHTLRHHHLICMNCGKICAVESTAVQRALNSIEQKSGYKIIDHQVKLYGYCRDCQD